MEVSLCKCSGVRDQARQVEDRGERCDWTLGKRMGFFLSESHSQILFHSVKWGWLGSHPI